MARRKRAQKRKVLPDPVYKEVLVTKFINKLMLDGKKVYQKKYFMKQWRLFPKK